MTASQVLMIIATILLFLAAFGVFAEHVSLGWLGLALWALSLIWPTFKRS